MRVRRRAFGDPMVCGRRLAVHRSVARSWRSVALRSAVGPWVVGRRSTRRGRRARSGGQRNARRQTRPRQHSESMTSAEEVAAYLLVPRPLPGPPTPSTAVAALFREMRPLDASLLCPLPRAVARRELRPARSAATRARQRSVAHWASDQMGAAPWDDGRAKPYASGRAARATAITSARITRPSPSTSSSIRSRNPLARVGPMARAARAAA